MSADLKRRREIAEELLGQSLSRDGYARCPGIKLHTHQGGTRDFRVILDNAPTGYCFHQSCAGAVDSFNRELRSRIAKAEGGRDEDWSSPYGKTARKPEAAKRDKRPPYDARKLASLAGKCPVEITPDWLLERSPVKLEGTGGALAGAFLTSLYQAGERVLIFTKNFSQGDFLFCPSLGGFRLAERPGVKAVQSALPEGGPEGVWFLVQPVTGEWLPNHNNRGRNGKPKMGRRHGDCVTAWRYLVLESDDAPEELWLKALVQMPFPIVAIYTSGGRSIHALVRVGCGSKAIFDSLRDEMVQVLAPLGADAAAMTAVRLSRLPGMMRHGTKGKDGALHKYAEPRLQRLLWLNPKAEGKAILQTVKL